MPASLRALTHISNSATPITYKATVLYDGQCVFCRRQVSFLEKLSAKKLRFLDLHQHWQDYPQLDLAEALREMKLIDVTGRSYGGAAAIAKLLELCYPFWGKAAKLYDVPGITWFCDTAYKLIAENRYRLMGKDEACESGSCAVKFK